MRSAFRYDSRGRRLTRHGGSELISNPVHLLVDSPRSYSYLEAIIQAGLSESHGPGRYDWSSWSVERQFWLCPIHLDLRTKSQKVLEMECEITNSISQKGRVTYRCAQRSESKGPGARTNRGRGQTYDRPVRTEIQVIDITTI